MPPKESLDLDLQEPDQAKRMVVSWIQAVKDEAQQRRPGYTAPVRARS
jgi:hypothetical protein